MVDQWYINGRPVVYYWQCAGLLLWLHVLFIFIGHATLFCCYDYAIDLLVELSKTVNFTYDLHLSEDNMYGSRERVC